MEQGSEHSLIQQLQGKIAGLEASASREQVMSHSIRELLKGGAAYVGPAFFPAVVQNLSSVLSAEFVFVGRLSEDSKSVETISLWGDGQILPNMAYDLFNTPCANVIGEDVCVHPSCVTAAFPEDQLLIDMRIEGYVGIPLFGSDGAPIGIMVALYREPVPDSDFASTLMLVFAARTSAEMERIHQDEERRKLEENLLQNQKLEGLGVLAGGIAHDFNNILMTILASADLAELALEPGHPAVSRIHLIAKTASQAGELCRQLLAYAGKGQFELKGHNLSHLVRDLEQFLRTSSTSKVTLRLDLPPNLPTMFIWRFPTRVPAWTRN